MNWNFKKNLMHMQVSAENITTWWFSFQNYSKVKHVVWRLDEALQPVPLEKSRSNTRKHRIYMHTFGQSRPIKVWKKDKKRTLKMNCFFLHNQTFSWDLDGKNPDSCFEGNRVWISQLIKQMFNFWLFCPKRSHLRQISVLFCPRVLSYIQVKVV